MLLKLTGLVLLAGCCAAAGIAASGRLLARAAQLEAAVGLTGLMAGELRYTLAPMPQVVARLAQLPSALPFVVRCSGLCGQGVTFPVAWKRAVTECGGALLEADKSVLLHMGAVLGTVNLEGALGELEYAKFALSQRHGEAVERREQLGGLYKTLGALAGVALVVVLY